MTAYTALAWRRAVETVKTKYFSNRQKVDSKSAEVTIEWCNRTVSRCTLRQTDTRLPQNFPFLPRDAMHPRY